MALHLLRASPLSEQLASGKVSARDQAFYLSGSFIMWLLPGYLFIIPPPIANVWPIPFGLWFYEAFAMLVIYVFGVSYCYARCHVEPRRNFLIDFSCLYAPISVTTLLIVWGLFHLYASLLPWWLQKQTFDSPQRFFEFIYSARFFDLMRFFAMVSASFFVFVRVGNHMERLSNRRLSANPTADTDARKSGARGSP